MADNPVQAPRPAATLAFWAHSAIVVGVSVCGLYFFRDLLIPIAIASLLFLLLTSVIDRIATTKIAGHHVPNWLAHVLGLGIVFFGLLAIINVLSAQAREVAIAVPKYQERLTAIVARLVELVGDDNAEALRGALEGVDIAGFALGTVNSASGFLSGLFLVLLYIPFMMVERKPMRSKLSIASPDPEVGTAITQTVWHISDSLQRYVGIKTAVSSLIGLLCYGVMKAIGLDFAETWGVLTFALNFIPSIGSILAVLFPAIVSLVQFDSITPFLIIVIGCGAVQFVVGNIIEPAMTGKSLNLSPMMVILALTTWTALWGLAGAFLSVPITVGMMIIFAHVPGLKWAAVLMSGDGMIGTSTGPPDTAPPDNSGEAPPGQDDLEAKAAALRQELDENRKR